MNGDGDEGKNLDTKVGEGWGNDDQKLWTEIAKVEDGAGNVPAPRPDLPVGLARKPHVLFDENRQYKFLEEYAKTGLKAHSAAVAGVSIVTVTNFEKQNEEFKALVFEAKEFFGDNIEREAHRRAVEGVLEPVFSQKEGHQIGVVRKYSDRLLEILLKSKRPEQFRDNLPITGGFKGGVLMVPVAVQTDEQWEQQFGDQVKGLPAPKE